MGAIFEHFKGFLSCFVLGVLCGGVCVLLATRGSDSRDIPASAVTTTTVSGVPQYVDNIKTSHGVLSWTTTAHGAGVSTTTLPIKLIPEANNWLTKRHTVMAKGYYLWTPDGFYPGAGVDYIYRVERFNVSCGVLFSQKYAGVSAGVGLTF